MSKVVRFPTEQCRLPGEDRRAFAQRQADEQFWQAEFAAQPQPTQEEMRATLYRQILDSIKHLK